MNTTTTAHLGPRKRLNKGKTTLLAAALLAITLTLFFIEENWRGKRAWNQFKAEYEAQGKSLDWKSLIPPEIPAEQNMFAVPVMRQLIKGEASNPKIGTIEKAQPPANQTASSSIMDFPNSALKANDLLVATISLSAPSSPQKTNIILVKTPLEAAAEIEEHTTLRALGAWGKVIVAESVAKAPPLEIQLLAEQLPHTNIFREILGQFTFRPADSNSLDVLLLDAWTAEDYLASTPSIEKEWAPLAAALQRPSARIPGDYTIPWKTPIPDFVRTRTIAQTLAQQAQSYLLLGQPAEAFKRLSLMHRLRVMLYAPPTHEPATLVTTMINVAVGGLYAAVVEDGFTLRAWGSFELAKIQKEVREIDLIPMIGASFESELIATTHAFRTTPFSEVFDAGNDPTTHLIEFLPRGWVHQNAATYGRLMAGIVAASQSALPRVDPQSITSASDHMISAIEKASPFIYLSRIAVPNFLKAIQTATRNETKLRLAEIACALERYHLAHNDYPPALGTLVPEYMQEVPREIVAKGQEFQYRRLSNDKFLLYSVGWNEKDDHGVPGLVKEGDWVWNNRD